MTDAERKLWAALRRRQLNRWYFRRQAQIGPYIADFVCFDAKLVVEVDGGQHAFDAERDAVRTAWLKSRGFHVLRFWNHDVLLNREGVLRMIWEELWVQENLLAKPTGTAEPPLPNPPPQGGRESPEPAA